MYLACRLDNSKHTYSISALARFAEACTSVNWFQHIFARSSGRTEPEKYAPGVAVQAMTCAQVLRCQARRRLMLVCARDVWLRGTAGEQDTGGQMDLCQGCVQELVRVGQPYQALCERWVQVGRSECKLWSGIDDGCRLGATGARPGAKLSEAAPGQHGVEAVMTETQREPIL